MKKQGMIFFILAILSCPFVIGQRMNLYSGISYYDDYVKFNDSQSLTLAKEKIDLAAVNEKTKGNAKTWFFRGKIYYALHDEKLKQKMSISPETDMTKKMIDAYQDFSMDENEEALHSFLQAKKLDSKKNYEDEINEYLRRIGDSYSEKGYSVLKKGNYTDAIVNYEKSYEIKKQYFNQKDTAIINNLAFAFEKNFNYEKAELYYNELISMNYQPEKCYLILIQMYTAATDTKNAARIISNARIAIPGSYPILVEEINFLLKQEKTTEALQSIEKAIEKNPASHELYLVLGQTYNKLAHPRDQYNNELPLPANHAELENKAETAFRKAVELMPDYFIGLFSLGIFYNNIGAEFLKAAEEMKDPKKVKEEESKADGIFLKAIPFLEKAHELNPDDVDTMRTLRQLYIRTGKGNTPEYKELDEKLKEISKK